MTFSDLVIREKFSAALVRALKRGFPRSGASISRVVGDELIELSGKS
jgi:hypothetical protein